MVTDTNRRGAQIFASDLDDGLSSKGQIVRTVALVPGDYQPKLDIPALGSSHLGGSTLRVLRDEMKQVDATIAHGSKTLLACRLAASGTSTPWVYRQIGDSRFWAPSIGRRLRVASALRGAAHVVALSSGAADVLHEYLWVRLSDVTVIPNGVPASRFLPADSTARSAARAQFDLPESSFVGLYIGGLDRAKGVDLAITATAAVATSHLLVIGDGPDRKLLEDAAEAHAPGQVTFVGALSDVRPAYAAADVLLCPTRGGDSMPAVLIEAGLCGLPAITSPVGAIAEVVQDGITGIMVPVDDGESVAAALAQLAASPSECQRLGRAARSLCHGRFTIDIVTDQWIAVLRGVAASRRRRGSRSPNP